MTAKEFLEQKDLTLSKNMDGYKIPYSYLCRLLDEYATHKLSTIKAMIQERIDELDKYIYDPLCSKKLSRYSIHDKELLTDLLNQIEK